MKRGVQIFYIMVFAALLLLPMCFLIAGMVNGNEWEGTGDKTAEEIPFAVEEYAGKHLPLRKQLLYANGWFFLNVLHQSPSNDVVMGKDDWFFYKGKQDQIEDPLSDYTGANLFTEEQLMRIADNMTASYETAKAAGAGFVVVLAPNKERIYHDYMPEDYGLPAEHCRLNQVYAYLKEHTEVPVVNVTQALADHRKAYPEDRLYIKSDTHWNIEGAYIASDVARAALSLPELPKPETLSRSEVNPPETDLAHLMGVDGYYGNVKEEMLNGYSPYTLTRVLDGVTEQRFVNEAGNAPYGKMFITGDSFSVGMMKYLACDFNDVYMTFHYKYDSGMIAEYRPDIIVYEVLERFLGYMETFRL